MDLDRAPEYDRLDSTESHQVVPFPLTQVCRTLAEQLKCAPEVVRG
jgi:hypothetical protein